MNIESLLLRLSLIKPAYVSCVGKPDIKIVTVDISEPGYIAGEGTQQGVDGFYLILKELNLTQWWAK